MRRRSPPRPRISRPVLIPFSPEISTPMTPVGELDSQPVSPISPEMGNNEAPPPLRFQSLAGRVKARPQTRYQMIVEEVQGQVDPFADPFTATVVIHELPATSVGLGVDATSGADIDREMENIYRSITEMERAMIREGQVERRRELMRESGREASRRLSSSPGNEWI